MSFTLKVVNQHLSRQLGNSVICHGLVSCAVTSKDIISVGAIVFQGFPFMNGGSVNSGGKNGHLHRRACCFRPLIVVVHVELVSVYLWNIQSLMDQCSLAPMTEVN